MSPFPVSMHCSLDARDEDSMTMAVAEVTSRFGMIDLLVNNAGYGLNGPLEDLPMDAIRDQFETNVFGLIRMSQLVLPGMRAQGNGRIINIGSIGGVIVAPGAGAYHSTKFAVEAISDAMRMEVKGFGIKVVLVQPTGVMTDFGNRIAQTFPVFRV